MPYSEQIYEDEDSISSVREQVVRKRATTNDQSVQHGCTAKKREQQMKTTMFQVQMLHS